MVTDRRYKVIDTCAASLGREAKLWDRKFLIVGRLYETAPKVGV